MLENAQRLLVQREGTRRRVLGEPVGLRATGRRSPGRPYGRRGQRRQSLTFYGWGRHGYLTALDLRGGKKPLARMAFAKSQEGLKSRSRLSASPSGAAPGAEFPLQGSLLLFANPVNRPAFWPALRESRRSGHLDRA